MSQRALLTIREAAEMLCVSDSTMRRWIDDGKMAYCRLGPRIIRIRPEAVEDFIECSDTSSESPSSAADFQSSANPTESTTCPANRWFGAGDLQTGRVG